MNNESYRKIIKNKYKRVSLVFLGVVLVLFLGSQYFVLYKEYQLATKKISDWLLLNKPKLEQALFLENVFSLEGHLREVPHLSDHYGTTSITIFDPNKKVIAGSSRFPDEFVDGFTSNFLYTHMSYFGKLEFADIPQGYVFIENDYSKTSVILYSMAVVIACVFLFVLFRLLVVSFLKTFNCVVMDSLGLLEVSIKSQALETL